MVSNPPPPPGLIGLKGGGVAEILHYDKVEGGIWVHPENDDVIMGEPVNKCLGIVGG